MKLNLTKQIEKYIFREKFTNKGQIRILKVCVIALADYALACAALTPLQQVSLLLALDHRQHLAGQDRDQWIRELAPLPASFRNLVCFDQKRKKSRLFCN